MELGITGILMEPHGCILITKVIFGSLLKPSIFNGSV